MKYLISFLKNETVFCVSFILAIFSFFLAPFSWNFVSGIDFRVLILLFCLMGVVAGFQKLLVFKRIGNYLIAKLNNTRTLFLLLIYLCFFSSMFLTNDVALITFVPFAIMLLPEVGQKKYLIIVVILQTVAANLGSVLTPIGNPQNLYLYSVSGMSFIGFCLMMLPICGISLVLITIPVLFIKNEKIESNTVSHLPKRNKRNEIVFTLLFVLSLLTVIRVLPHYVLLPIMIIVLAIVDRKVFANIDYFLLLTFVFFFIFIYNMKQIPAVTSFLSKIIEGHVFTVGVLTSQVISNVPAALLLSGFTGDYRALTYAVDVGGLGTLIASLASLISFKLYCAGSDAKPGKYFLQFTLWNVIYLAILYAITCFIIL